MAKKFKCNPALPFIPFLDTYIRNDIHCPSACIQTSPVSTTYQYHEWIWIPSCELMPEPWTILLYGIHLKKEPRSMIPVAMLTTFVSIFSCSWIREIRGIFVPV